MENEVKEPAPKYNYIPPDTYLQMERATEEKNEYYDGMIYAMSGASLKHNIISSNLAGEIMPFLKDKDCRMLLNEMRVSTPSRDAYMYPDAVIVCGEPQLEDGKFDTLLNPSVIIEILSRSTRSIDKGRKFFFYREIPGLKEYIMIDSLRRHIIIARKDSDDSWKFHDIASGELLVQTIGFSINVSLIYNDTDL